MTTWWYLTTKCNCALMLCIASKDTPRVMNVLSRMYFSSCVTFARALPAAADSSQQQDSHKHLQSVPVRNMEVSGSRRRFGRAMSGSTEVPVELKFTSVVTKKFHFENGSKVQVFFDGVPAGIAHIKGTTVKGTGGLPYACMCYTCPVPLDFWSGNLDGETGETSQFEAQVMVDGRPPPRLPFEENQWYQIKAKCSGKVLDIMSGTNQNQNGAQIWQWASDHQDPSQFFGFEDVGDGRHFAIKSVLTGRLLTVKNNSPNDGQEILLWERDGNSTSQHFRVQHFTIAARHSQKNLQIRHGDRDNGSALEQWVATDCDSQLFEFVTGNPPRHSRFAVDTSRMACQATMTILCGGGPRTQCPKCKKFFCSYHKPRGTSVLESACHPCSEHLFSRVPATHVLD